MIDGIKNQAIQAAKLTLNDAACSTSCKLWGDVSMRSRRLPFSKLTSEMAERTSKPQKLSKVDAVATANMEME